MRYNFMNFTKKALLGLLFVNLIAVSPAFSTVESKVEEQQETTLSEKAYNFVVNKKTVAVLGLGLATYVAYKYGAFDKVRNWFYGTPVTFTQETFDIACNDVINSTSAHVNALTDSANFPIVFDTKFKEFAASHIAELSDAVTPHSYGVEVCGKLNKIADLLRLDDWAVVDDLATVV